MADARCRPPEQYALALQQSGLDEATARFVAALDTSIARGDLHTGSQDLAHLLGHPAAPLAEVVRARYNLLKVRSTTATIGLIGAGMIGGTIAYAYRTDGSFDQPQPAGVGRLTSLLAHAKR